MTKEKERTLSLWELETANANTQYYTELMRTPPEALLSGILWRCLPAKHLNGLKPSFGNSPYWQNRGL